MALNEGFSWWNQSGYQMYAYLDHNTGANEEISMYYLISPFIVVINVLPCTFKPMARLPGTKMHKTRRDGK